MSRNEDNFYLIFAIVATVALGIIALIGMVIPMDDNPGLETAKKAGYTDAVVIEHGHLAFECSEDDTTYYQIRAKNPRNETVDFIVCCGGIKACTIRFIQ